jgi:hypothetical protein
MQHEGGKKGDTWEIDNDNGEIEPNGTITLQITATILEHGLNVALLRVHMQESLNFVDIKMTAMGDGASLIFNPALEFHDTIDFGTIFTQV